ncbi:unnamed protein product [Cuscuta campestris]|uniref:Uncharacterized protein n=1 Tax=Cuscuta campestris TaxID=132261 RepID=A0A484LYZ8_9ASTE|nr:unnamed protein product [Cuscuta campestris]
MWCVVDLSKTADTETDDLEEMCRYAVNLSHGELIDIAIDGFCTNESILYIANRSALQVFCFSFITFDLQIYFPELSTECIKTIGLSCPLLKSFTYENCEHPGAPCDNKAIAVAEKMQGLCRLSLFGIALTEKGVRAILDGCPYLESLDLRRSFNVTTLEGYLGGRCKEIKHLKHPTDPISYYEVLQYVEGNMLFLDSSRNGLCREKRLHGVLPDALCIC